MVQIFVSAKEHVALPQTGLIHDNFYAYSHAKPTNSRNDNELYQPLNCLNFSFCVAFNDIKLKSTHMQRRKLTSNKCESMHDVQEWR